MLAGIGGLLDDGNRQRFAALLLLELREPQRRGQAARPAADDQDVDFKRLALSHQPFWSSAMIAGASSNRSPWMP